MIRNYKPADCKRLAELFYDTVHTVNAEHYTEEQINAWTTGTVDEEEWNKSFLKHFTVVAEEDGLIVGFGDIDGSGYLDRLYVDKHYQRRGIATAICDNLERHVKSDKIVCHSSITAKGFFIKRGYSEVKKQQVIRNGVALTNFVMEKKTN